MRSSTRWSCTSTGLTRPGGSKLSFVTEYAYSFLATARLALKARRSGRFAVIQACNPPDIFWPIALCLARPRWHPVRLRSSRSVPGTVRVPLPRRAEAALPGLARSGAQDPPDGGSRHFHERLLPRHRDQAERQGPRRRHDRPHRPRSAAPAARSRRPRAPPGAHVPGRVHRRHGTPGRGRHRGAGRRHRGPRTRSRRHRLHADRLGRLLQRSGGAARRAGPGRPRGVHRPGAGRTRHAAFCPPPT